MSTFNFGTNLDLTGGKYFIKIILTLYEQLIIGYISMDFHIFTNYFKMIRLGYYFL